MAHGLLLPWWCYSGLVLVAGYLDEGGLVAYGVALLHGGEGWLVSSASLEQ